MGLSGHAFDAISKLAWYRSERKLKRERIAHIRSLYTSYGNSPLSLGSSDEPLRITTQIKNKIRKDLEKEWRTILIIFISISLIIVSLVVLLLNTQIAL